MSFPIPIIQSLLFGRRNASPDMTLANGVMRQANPHAMIGAEGRNVVMIEDVSDPDGRMYRMEYQSTADGRHAIAFCRHNPWGGVNGGAELNKGHVDRNGLLCMGRHHSYSQNPASSGHGLAEVIQRSRYWCTAFSVLMETGRFPQP